MTSIEETSKAFLESSGSGSENLSLYDTITSEETCRVIEIIFNVALTGALSVLGLAANDINIIIFFKQGFNDSINISLCGLAVSDMGVLLPLVWRAICYSPQFQDADIGFDSIQIQEVTAGWTRVCFVRITSLITAFITLERCVCIALPLKVKDIITPKRTLLSIIAIFVLMFAISSPLFCSIYLAASFDIERNKTLVKVTHINTSKDIEAINFSVNNSVHLCCVVIVIVCTANLIHNMLAQSQWRLSFFVNSSLLKPDSVSSREKRIMKLVTLLSCIFVVCFLPRVLNLILTIQFSQEYKIGGRYHNSYIASWSFINLLEAINSSVNILIYYNMSSKFRAGFNKLFGIAPIQKMASNVLVKLNV